MEHVLFFSLFFEGDHVVKRLSCSFNLHFNKICQFILFECAFMSICFHVINNTFIAFFLMILSTVLH